ncbi:MAG TPA: transcription termination/antitermination NusG family protein [Anaerolineaceae bacterium]|nr:transcription termination/antitermination NusG family protein [Anaerolineaceae bacterium]
MESFWYVIQSHPNKEQMLYTQLELLGLEIFFPKIRVKPVNPRSRKIRPYFPGYIFLKTDLETITTSTIKWMPHSRGIVSFGGEASIVPESLIQALKQKFGESAEAIIDLNEEIQSGAPVTIEYGPFKGYEGIFDMKLDGSDRARILIKMLSDNYVSVELEISQIQKKQKKP